MRDISPKNLKELLGPKVSGGMASLPRGYTTAVCPMVKLFNLEVPAPIPGQHSRVKGTNDLTMGLINVFPRAWPLISFSFMKDKGVRGQSVYVDVRTWQQQG